MKITTKTTIKTNFNNLKEGKIIFKKKPQKTQNPKSPLIYTIQYTIYSLEFILGTKLEFTVSFWIHCQSLRQRAQKHKPRKKRGSAFTSFLGPNFIIIRSHQRQQKPGEVNELLEKEETLAHKREAVIDAAVLLCHTVHGRPQE